MFDQVNRRIVVQCYRANELSAFGTIPGPKESKKIQKDILRKTAGVSSQDVDTVSVYAGAVEPTDNTTAPKEQYRSSRLKKNKKKLVFHDCKCKVDETDENENSKYRAKNWDSITEFYGNADTTQVWTAPETQISTIAPEEYNTVQYVIDTNAKSTDYTKGSKKHKRKSKTHKKRGHYVTTQFIDKQSYPISDNPIHTDTIPASSLFKKENIKKKLKAHEATPEELTTITPFKNTCPGGVCAEETKTNKSFLCKCINRNKESHLNTKECIDTTCKLAQDSSSTNSVVSIKDKILCLCHKYSQKIINMKPQNDNIVIKNKKSKRSKLSNQAKKINDVVITKEHQSEQTGAPFFEIQVNPQDMCVLNPIEIRKNIIRYGRTEKYEPTCICPSRGRLSAGEVCKSGVCKKAYKNKQINFKCWCPKERSECGDTTCDINIRNSRMKPKIDQYLRNPKVNKPLLEVQLDMDKMCVVNPEEIEDKILTNISVDDVCSSGICREAALKRKTPFSCKCISKKISSDITECKQSTCTDTTKKQNAKFSSLYTRIRSKSENWLLRKRIESQKRIQRRAIYEISPSKLSRGGMFTQTHKTRKGKKVNKIKKKANRRKLNTTQKDINKHNPKKQYNYNKYFIPRPGKFQFHNSSKSKHTEIPHEWKYKTKDVICACAHTRQCNLNKKHNVNIEFKKSLHKKRKQRNSNRETERRRQLQRKIAKQSAKQRLKEIKAMRKKTNEEPLQANFCTAFFLGILNIGVNSIFLVFKIMWSLIRHPKRSYWYVMDRIKDPEDTWTKLKKWYRDAVMIKKLQVSETIRGSDTLTILADQFLDTPLYQSMADKGKTKQDQIAFEQKSRARKRRIRMREEQAIRSCRHMLLTTLRQTPCLWVYHICPNFYPQCLGLMAFMRSFSRIFLFLVAFACWTPCILCFEICRAFLCCFMCTG